MPRAGRVLLLGLGATVAFVVVAALLPVGAVAAQRSAPALPGVNRVAFPAWAHAGDSVRAAVTASPGIAQHVAPPATQRSAGLALVASGGLFVAAITAVAIVRRAGRGLRIAAAPQRIPTPPPRAA